MPESATAATAARPLAARLASKAPPRPPLGVIATGTFASIATLIGLVALGYASGHVLLIPPMAASMALIVGAPTLPLSQPRNIIGGQLISALTGVSVGFISHSIWAAAVAGGLALGAMLLLRVSHSPAAATAVIGCLTTGGMLSFVICTAIAAAALVLAGILRARIVKIAYPTYWW